MRLEMGLIKDEGRRTKLTDNEYKERINQIYSGNIITIEPYVNNRTKIKHKCIKHNQIYMAFPPSVQKGHSGCPDCKKEKYHFKNLETIEGIKRKLFEKYDNEYILINEPKKYTGFKQTLEFLHTPLNGTKPHIVKSRFSRIMADVKCPVCCGIQISKGFNDIATLDPEFASLFKDIKDTYKYTLHSNKKAYFVCPTCGHEMYKSINSVYSDNKNLRCPICSDGVSYPNKFIYNMFKLYENKLDFLEREYRPEWCEFIFKNEIRHGIYDIYFGYNGEKYIVEMDGGLGHGNEKTMITLASSESKYIDEQKDHLANLHDIKIIRIDCNYKTEDRYFYIKNSILESELNNILDLSIIDFNEVNKMSLESYFLKVCDIWNKTKNLKQVLEQVPLRKSTIIKYIKQGWEYHLCENNIQLNDPINFVGIPVICLNNKEIYKSASDASKYYGIDCKGILGCCKDIDYSAGRDKITGERLFWMHLDDYKKLNDNEVKLYIQNKYDQYEERTNCYRVINLTTKKIFMSISEAARYYNIFPHGIKNCCKGTQKTSGKINNERMKWCYYTEYIKDNNIDDFEIIKYVA